MPEISLGEVKLLIFNDFANIVIFDVFRETILNVHLLTKNWHSSFVAENISYRHLE